MPTLIELPRLRETSDLCRTLGLSFVELNMNMPSFCPEELEASAIKRVSDETGLGFTVHLPEELDLASIHPSIREGHIRRCREAIEWAGSAGAKLVNLHINSGVYFTLPNRRAWIYEQHVDAFVPALVQAMTQLYAWGNENGVTVCVENAGDFAHGFIREAIEQLSAIHGFALTWDVGHDASNGHSDQPLILANADSVRHMHLHDCIGKSSHLVLTTGEVDVAGSLAFARERDLGVVVEVKTVEALTESIRGIEPLLESGLEPE